MLIIAIAVMAAPCRLAAAQPEWVRLESAAPGMNIDINRSEQIEVSVSDGTVYLYTSAETTVKIFTILGQQVTTKKLTPGVWSFRLSARGIYILKAGALTKRLSV